MPSTNTSTSKKLVGGDAVNNILDLSKVARREGNTGVSTKLDPISSDADLDVDKDVDKELARIAEEVMHQLSWSAKIRYLHAEGFTNSAIAKILTEIRGHVMRPQHVNNVLKYKLKQGSRPRNGHNQALDPRAAALVQLLPKQTLLAQTQTQPDC